MAQVFPGRWTAKLSEDDRVVFLIGMRFNKPLRIDKWFPVFLAMPRMLRYLSDNEDAGMLGGHAWFGRTTILVTYWESVDKLIEFASAQTAPHREAWRKFNRAIGNGGTVGVWHETYLTGPGRAEAVYVNMPAFGLGAATEHVKVGATTTSAHKRLAVDGKYPRSA
ncbi:MAG: DUF4188 domain-containing protein [Sciscionella sp.]|nr:DUF4188 domain-containing protein [Sciscionella sp.]